MTLPSQYHLVLIFVTKSSIKALEGHKVKFGAMTQRFFQAFM